MKEPKAYSGDQILIGTLLFGPLLGGWMISSNYKILGMSHKAMKPLAAAVGILFALLLLGILITNKVAGFALTAASSLLFQLYFDKYQKNFIKAGLEKGGKLASGWKVFGVGLLTLPVTVFLVIVFGVLANTLGFGPPVSPNNAAPPAIERY